MIQAERRLLESGNRAIGVVVHDEPDDVKIELSRRRQDGRVLPKTTITDKRDHRTTRRRELRADSGRRSKTHRGIATRSEHAARRIHVELLSNTVLIPTDIGGNDGVSR